MEDLCSSCLCGGRNLYFLEEAKSYNIYLQILSEIPVYNMSAICIRLCWECRAVMHRFMLFKQQVKQSYQQLLKFQDCSQDSSKMSIELQPHLKISILESISYPVEIKLENDNDVNMESNLFMDYGIDITDNKLKTEGNIDDNGTHCEPETFVNNLNVKKVKVKKKLPLKKTKKKVKTSKTNRVIKNVNKKKKSRKKSISDESVDNNASYKYSDDEIVLEKDGDIADKVDEEMIGNIETKELRCANCDKTFVTDIDLDSHINSAHTNKKLRLCKDISKRKICKYPGVYIKNALLLIRNGASIREASKAIGVPFATLRRYHHKTKNADSLDSEQLEPNYRVNMVFTIEQEVQLKDDFNYCIHLFYGLTSKECRKIAFDCAKIKKLKVPSSWETNHQAGKDWLMLFRHRHKLTVKRPESCNAERVMFSIRNNVEKFYDNLETLIEQTFNFPDGTRIFNLGQILTMTVKNSQRALAPKGNNGIGKTRQADTLVTTCCIIGASGIALPPIMIFPQKDFNAHVIRDTQLGNLSLTSSTGHMESTLFSKVMEHFIKYTNPTKDNPCILIMQNSASYLCIEALDLARAAGVHILTLHHQTAHKLQPLEVGIYNHFKIYYNDAIDTWSFRHPEKPITMYNVIKIISTAFQMAMTPENVKSSFAKCGIYPYNRHKISDKDFLPNSVRETDRPCPECSAREVLISRIQTD